MTGQLDLALDAPTAPPGTWVCGICYCVRPEDQLWCSHLADHDQRDRLHRRLEGCDNPICVPAFPCALCSELIADQGIPWPPAYRCLSCKRMPGEEHAPECDDAGSTVPSIADQFAMIERMVEQAADEDAAAQIVRCPKGHELTLPAGSMVPLSEQRCWCGTPMAGEKPRRAAPSTIAAESVECPECHSLPGSRCRNYRGKGCAPHRQRVTAAKVTP